MALSACTTSRQVSRGIGCIQSGNLDGAIEALNQAIEASPDFSEAYFHRGNTWLKKGEYQKAISDLSRAIEIDPKYADAYLSRATAYIEEKENQKGLSDLSKSIALKPDLLTSYLIRGLLYKKMGDTDKATADFDHVIKVAPDKAYLGYFQRGLLYKEQGKMNAALADFSRCRLINPSDPGIYIQQAEIRLLQKKFDQAIENSRLALRIFPLASSAYRIWGDALMGKKDYDLALWNYSEAIDIDPDSPGLYIRRAEAWKTVGNTSAACKDFKRACQIMTCDNEKLLDWMQKNCSFPSSF